VGTCGGNQQMHCAWIDMLQHFATFAAKVQRLRSV
jgi:hypothetical protein